MTAEPPTQSYIALPEKFDIAISFAGPQRDLAERLATILRGAGLDVFYDNFYPAVLWGKDLVELFGEIYCRRARFCVMVISQDYAQRMWTILERRNALARALEERGNEYILPIRVDDTELPGLLPTIGYVSLKQYTIDQIAEMLIRKLLSQPAHPHALAAPLVTLATTGDNFAQEYGLQWNASAYAGLFIGAVPEKQDELEEAAIDSVELWIQTVEPLACAYRTTPEVGWWRIRDESSSYDAWSCRLLPGPVLAIRQAMTVTQYEDGGTVSFPALIDEWTGMLSSLPQLLTQLGMADISLGFTFNTVVLDPTTIPIVDLEFNGVPQPRKAGSREGVPPWSYKTPVISVSHPFSRVARTAAERLLRHFSYRQLDSVLEWTDQQFP